MRYMGSKAKYTKHIIPHILANHKEGKPYVEPFCGGGNMLSEIPLPNKWGNDTAKYAVALLDAIGNKGYKPPEIVSEEDYQKVKENPENYNPAYVGFLAYCCSYAGKFWGGFWRAVDSKGNPRNGAKEQVNNLLKQSKGLSSVKFTTLSYLDLSIQSGSTVYCDPPYAGTTGYKGEFNHDKFWSWCSSLVDSGCNVLVSEYTAPPNWLPVWEKEVTNSLTKDTGSKRGVEKLFMRYK